MNSIWKRNPLERFAALSGGAKTDVLIIGGGMAGILCAYFLKQAGADYMLIESGSICNKTTANTTAKITSQHGLVYHKVASKSGIEAAEMYLKTNEDARLKFREMCKKIDCDFSETDSYAYTLDSPSKIEKELKVLQAIGFDAKFAMPDLPLKTAGAVLFKNQAQFNPLKFIAGIVRGLNIFENTKALEFLPDGVITDKGRITANRIIVATHFPILNKHGLYFGKMYQHRSYVLALKNAPCVNGIYVDDNKKGLSFRNHNGLLLLGGGGHKTGKQGGNWRELETFAKEKYPNAQVVARWAAQDCMTLDNIPYIGEYSKNTPNLYVSTGFNKWGMTSSMAAATLLCDILTGKQNPYSEIFSPSRKMLALPLLTNGANAVFNLLIPTVPRCPHLGCALKYNKAEHSWDCPCHGSRFDEKGCLLDGPATDDRKKI